MLTVKLYTNSGTYIKDLPAVFPVSIQAARGRDIRRTARFSLEKTYLPDVKVLGRRIKIMDEDSNQRFAGYIDDVDRSVHGSSWLDISCRDNAKVYERAGFTEDVTYEDTSYTDTTRAITSSSASTEMAAGDELQGQGKVYGVKLEATALGVTSEVDPDSATGDILAGDYSTDYYTEGMTRLTLTFYIDLLAQEAIGSFTVTSNSTTSSKQYSTDGVAFSDFAGTPTGRYLKVVLTRSTAGLDVHPITAGVTITANGAFPASNVETDNATPWRPDPTDLDRELTLTFASALVNGLNIKCGVSDLDRETAYIADLYYDNAGTMTLHESDVLLLCGFNEICFTAVTTTELKLIFKKLNAPVAVRYAIPIYNDSTATIDQIIETILGTEGETDFTRITETRRAPAGHAITYLAGQKKLRACAELAESINFEFFYDTDERPVLRPKRWSDPMDANMVEITAHLEWSARLSDAEIFNAVLAQYEAGDAQYFATATNDSGASSTSTINIGTRTSDVLRNPLANTQAKLDAWAAEKLAELTRQAVSGRSTIGALDSAGSIFEIEPQQIVRITDPDTGETALFVVDSCPLIEAETVIDYAGLEVTSL